MILNLWLKLFFIALLVTLPLMTAQYWMQKESIELVFSVAQKGSGESFLNAHMSNLKKLSQLDPSHAENYRAEFENAADSRSLGQDMQLIQHQLIDDLLMQTLRNTLLVLLVALAVTYWIARSIVRLLKRLVSENQTQALRLERVGALESWQKISRMMVHEMRAPITPIKLVATDIENKFTSLEPAAFQRYLASGAELIRNQVQSIERLTDNLTKFAKLPEVQKKPGRLADFFAKFISSYSSYGDGLVQTVYLAPAQELPLEFDEALLQLLFFNLLKNAHEANLNDAIRVVIDLRQDAQSSWIRFANSGAPMPAAIAQSLFSLYVSSKDKAGANFGVGLTIARKIALDHRGDLHLKTNTVADGVIFELELPNL